MRIGGGKRDVLYLAGLAAALGIRLFKRTRVRLNPAIPGPTGARLAHQWRTRDEEKNASA